MSRLLVVALLAGMLLAGCGSPDNPQATNGSQPPIEAGKGAISGLLIDDVYRPIAKALILVQGAGLTATTDDAGQFTLLNLNPGAYILVMQADGFEAAPKNVDVKEGLYNPVEYQARRIVNQGSQILTEEYSVFIPCTFAVPVAGWVTFNCVLDLSGDSFRSSTDPLNYSAFPDLTYLVAEAKMNRVGSYNFVVRPPGSDVNGTSYGDAVVQDTDYAKVILKKNELNPGGNIPWYNHKTLEAALFVSGQIPVSPDPGFPNGGPGLGANVAVRATIIVSVFLGLPTVDVESYHLL